MRYFYDTEFLEDGKTVELISIAVVSETGREFYAVNSKMPIRRIRKHPWLMTNVVPTLPKPSGDWNLHMPKSWLFDYNNPVVMRPELIRNKLLKFLGSDLFPNSGIELWAYYGAYDHLVLCQLFGRMIDLPEGMPMFTHELMQLWEESGKPEKPQQKGKAHNALEDARWNLDLFKTCTLGE